MTNAIDARQKAIGQRLRDFRKSLKISRTAFAVEIGIGSERLSSYESGRVPLRYEMFSAITKRFFLSPFWLATGESSARLSGPYDDSKHQAALHPRMLLSEAFDSVLMKDSVPVDFDAIQKLASLERILLDLRNFAWKENVSLDVLRQIRDARKLVSQTFEVIDREFSRSQSSRDSVSKEVLRVAKKQETGKRQA